MNIGRGGERIYEDPEVTEFESVFIETFGERSRHALQKLLDWSKRDNGKFKGQATLEIPVLGEEISTFFTIIPGGQRFNLATGRFTNVGENDMITTISLNCKDFNIAAAGREDDTEYVILHPEDWTKALKIEENGRFQLYDNLPSVS